MELWLWAVNILLWLLSFLLISLGMVLVIIDVRFWWRLFQQLGEERAEQSGQKALHHRLEETSSHGRAIVAAASFALASFLVSVSAVFIVLCGQD